MTRNLYRVNISKLASQRGTGKPISRNEALVYDFMPITLGDHFRTDPTLSRMLLRPPPVDAPFMLEADAYQTLGLSYVKKGEIIPAMECYRIVLDSRTSFVEFISGMQKNILLNKDEVARLELFTPLEELLIKEHYRLRFKPDPELYTKWVEELRKAEQRWSELNHNDYGSEEYVIASLNIGKYQEALYNAQALKNRKLVSKVKSAAPREILNLKFLRKYIHDNFPESSIDR